MQNEAKAGAILVAAIWGLFIGVFGLAAQSGASVSGAAPNSAPNPYRAEPPWGKLPEGRAWGAVSAIDIDPDGESVWVAERCGANGCIDATGRISDVDPILKFDPSGKLLRSFGRGMLMSPHGIFVDPKGNVWVTDFRDNVPVATGRGNPAAGAGALIGPPPGATKGHQVFEFSPEGKLLLTLGASGGAAAPGFFYQPDDVIVAPTGEIFVSEGHGAANPRVLKFTSGGHLIRAFGKKGSGPGEFDQPHALAFDSKGRLLVGDVGNGRIQIFDRDGNYQSELTQFGRPSGIFVDKDDNVFVADSSSSAANHAGWKRGIRIGSLKDGKVTAFIPDSAETATGGTSGAEGVAVDARGNVYGAEVAQRRVVKYVR